MKMRLYERSRSLSLALGILDLKVGEDTASMGTDGWNLYVNGAWLREAFLADSGALLSLFLHVLCHCMLGHPFRYQRERRQGSLFGGKRSDGKALPETELEYRWEAEAWELVEEIAGKRDWQEGKARETAVQGEVQALQDDHSLWERRPVAPRRRISASGPGSGAASGTEEGKDGEKRSPGLFGERKTTMLWQEQRWETAHRSLLKEKDGGHRAGNRRMSVLTSLSLTEEKRYDYRVFLKQFARLREEGGLDTEQFDYGLYYQGLSWYGNVPFIEPLEYRERQKIEELVIVIDTSGSCGEELVRMFLEETRNILKEEDLFFSRFRLHILQCDNQVQKDDRITCQKELDAYLADLSIKGGGGTDFCPAFARIEELRREELTRLKGVVYFTDGYGIYPGQEPDYRVAFVFLKYRYDDIDVPGWAEKLVLDAKRPKGNGVI